MPSVSVRVVVARHRRDGSIPPGAPRPFTVVDKEIRTKPAGVACRRGRPWRAGYHCGVQNVSRSLSALAVALATSGVAAGQAPTPAVGLPPIACVEAVRSARIARDAGDAAAARTKLEAAIALPGCELPALAAILPLLRLGGYPDDRAAALRSRLTARLEDPTVELPEGLLTYLAGVPGDDELLLGALERRLAHAPAVDPKPPPHGLVELLGVTSDLQERRGKREAARDNLARLLALQPSESLQWRALFLDLALERWNSAAELLATMVDAPGSTDAPTILREMYVQALAHLGRFDEMTKQIEKLAPPPTPAPTAAQSSALDPSGPIRGRAAIPASSSTPPGRCATPDGTPRRRRPSAARSRTSRSTPRRSSPSSTSTAPPRSAPRKRQRCRRGAPPSPIRCCSSRRAATCSAPAMRRAPASYSRAPRHSFTAPTTPSRPGTTSAAPPSSSSAGTRQPKPSPQAIAVNPGRVESHYKRGIALFHLERCADAVAALRRTLELQPDRRDAHYYLAGCYRKLGDAAAAAREDAIFNAKP